MSGVSKRVPHVLSIAGSDPSGGAGIQADLKTIAALGGYGMASLTSLTAQNTKGVSGIQNIPSRFVCEQIRAIFDDVRVDAVKVGMTGTAEIVTVIGEELARMSPPFVVVDPVLVAGSGDPLSDGKTHEAVRSVLVPQASILTPNIPEAELLLDREFDGDFEAFAEALLELGCEAVFLKGGHLNGDTSIDVYADQMGVIRLEEPRLKTKNTHGTGCTLSSALAVFLAQGLSGADSARAAKAYITGALKHADELDVGQGSGPVNHFWMSED